MTTAMDKYFAHMIKRIESSGDAKLNVVHDNALIPKVSKTKQCRCNKSSEAHSWKQQRWETKNDSRNSQRRSSVPPCRWGTSTNEAVLSAPSRSRRHSDGHIRFMKQQPEEGKQISVENSNNEFRKGVYTLPMIFRELPYHTSSSQGQDDEVKDSFNLGMVDEIAFELDLKSKVDDLIGDSKVGKGDEIKTFPPAASYEPAKAKAQTLIGAVSKIRI